MTFFGDNNCVNNAHVSLTQTPIEDPTIEAPHTQLSQGLIGGCAGTQMGCCEDGVTQATMENGCDQRNMDDDGAASVYLVSNTLCTTGACEISDGPCPSHLNEGVTCTDNSGVVMMTWLIIGILVVAILYVGRACDVVVARALFGGHELHGHDLHAHRHCAEEEKVQDVDG